MVILFKLGMSAFLMYVVFTSEFTLMSIFGFIIAMLIFLSIFDTKNNVIVKGPGVDGPGKNHIDRTAGMNHVPGYGYRDKEGNYYDYNGCPIPTPVTVNDKKKK